DSYYVMDALTTRLPALLDATMRGADAAVLASGGPLVTGRAAQVGLATTAAQAVPNLGALHDGMAKAIAGTMDANLRAQADTVKDVLDRATAIGRQSHDPA